MSHSACIQNRTPAQGNQHYESRYHKRGNDYHQPYLIAPAFKTRVFTPTAKHMTNRHHRDGSNIATPVSGRDAAVVPCRHDMVGSTNHPSYTAITDGRRISEGTSTQIFAEPLTVRPGSPSKNVHQGSWLVARTETHSFDYRSFFDYEHFPVLSVITHNATIGSWVKRGGITVVSSKYKLRRFEPQFSDEFPSDQPKVRTNWAALAQEIVGPLTSSFAAGQYDSLSALLDVAPGMVAQLRRTYSYQPRVSICDPHSASLRNRLSKSKEAYRNTGDIKAREAWAARMRRTVKFLQVNEHLTSFRSL
ncbi:hypothetical protein RvY_19171 [Ramazzottius varieornatus]|uniref:Uncharacterized protein n=1 Tax=Ramazzottius varieornatus TaxID=947166 RepID=A0A1D1WC42_RAMVA|nr:hypothetical protein RvY_19171 [Ramazzottius varieornatus]